MSDAIQLLQFFICKDFQVDQNDCYKADSILGNFYVAKFPYSLKQLYAVTCWRKDEKFHKEVIEYTTGYGDTFRSPHMDIEPVKSSVLFRWHKHQFPPNLVIKEPTILSVKVILDWDVKFESYVMIEALPEKN